MDKNNEEIKGILVTFFRDATSGDYLEALNKAIDELQQPALPNNLQKIGENSAINHATLLSVDEHPAQPTKSPMELHIRDLQEAKKQLIILNAGQAVIDTVDGAISNAEHFMALLPNIAQPQDGCVEFNLDAEITKLNVPRRYYRELGKYLYSEQDITDLFDKIKAVIITRKGE